MKSIAMNILPYSYTVSSADVLAIQKLGYIIEQPSGKVEDFINKHFPNLDIKVLLASIDSLLTPYCLEKITRELEIINDIPPELSFAFYSMDFDNPETALGIYRKFTYEEAELVVWHDYFTLPEASRRQGIANKLLKLQLQQYINMNVGKIRIYATLSDGGYIWARHYFTADNKEEVDKILEKAYITLTENEFNDVKQVYSNYYTKSPNGKAFPIRKWAELPFMKVILRGSNWHGTLDLKNPKQFNNFIKYVSR